MRTFRIKVMSRGIVNDAKSQAKDSGCQDQPKWKRKLHIPSSLSSILVNCFLLESVPLQVRGICDDAFLSPNVLITPISGFLG